MLREEILSSVQEAVKAAKILESAEALQFIEAATDMIASCYLGKGKLLLCGNGGSLCDAMHFAEELTGVFRGLRPALPAIALSDPGHLSCVGNDLGFDQVFSRGVEAFGQEGDVLVVLTTSGHSKNILNALKIAQEKDLKTIAFLGKTGGAAQGVADLEWIVKGFSFSDRIQELHMTAIHIIIEMVERQLFAQPSLEAQRIPVCP